MKNLFKHPSVYKPHTIILILLTLIFFQCQTSTPTQDEYSNTPVEKVNVENCLYPPVGAENLISLDSHVLNVGKANRERKLFIQNFRYKKPNGDYVYFTDDIIEQIYKDHFCKFKQTCRTCTTNCRDTINGLRFVYGIDTTNYKIKLFYQPVCLTLTATTNDSVRFAVIKKIDKTDTIFKYEPAKGFIPATPNETLAISNYTQIVINKNTSPTVSWQAYRQNVDVGSTIFSLAEIGDLLNDNSKDTVSIYNAAFLKAISNSTDSLIYHSIILTVDGNINKLTGDFKGKYANLSHLCPPSCNQLTFKRK